MQRSDALPRSLPVTIQAPVEKLQLLDELQRLDALAEAARIRSEDPTPGHLAQRLDRLTVQTPALDLIDSELVLIRDAVRVMFARRQRYADLVHKGVAYEQAIDLAASEVESDGNDRLTISMPPQEGKSSRVSRYGVLWMLRQFPGLHVGLVSYDGDHASRISYLIRADIEVFNGEGGNPDLGLKLARNQAAVSRWLLAAPHSGDVYAIGIGGGITGRPIDLLIIDDPVKDMRAADSLLLSSQAWDWWQTAARPRLAPWAPVILIATRWHEADMIGRALAKQAEDKAAGLEHFDRWRVVNIPAQADHDPDKGETDILGRQPGEYMASARGRTRAQWEATKAATAPRFWTALYQGRPTPDTGDIWLRSWWRRYETPLWTQGPDGTFALPGYELTQSWDCAFRATDASDFVVGQVWAKRGADSYLVYQVWARLSFTDTIAAIRRVTHLFPQTRRKLIEAKANGDAVIDSLRHEIPGIIEAHPFASKVARATAVSPFVRAGNVHIPTSHAASMAPEISWDPESFLVECTAFPNARHDDQVDACSQYLHEAYLVSGTATLHVPEGRMTPRRTTQRLTPIQRRIRELERRAASRGGRT